MSAVLNYYLRWKPRHRPNPQKRIEKVEFEAAASFLHSGGAKFSTTVSIPQVFSFLLIVILLYSLPVKSPSQVAIRYFRNRLFV